MDRSALVAAARVNRHAFDVKTFRQLLTRVEPITFDVERSAVRGVLYAIALQRWTVRVGPLRLREGCTPTGYPRYVRAIGRDRYARDIMLLPNEHTRPCNLPLPGGSR